MGSFYGWFYLIISASENWLVAVFLEYSVQDRIISVPQNVLG